MRKIFQTLKQKYEIAKETYKKHRESGKNRISEEIRRDDNRYVISQIILSLICMFFGGNGSTFISRPSESKKLFESPQIFLLNFFISIIITVIALLIMIKASNWHF